MVKMLMVVGMFLVSSLGFSVLTEYTGPYLEVRYGALDAAEGKVVYKVCALSGKREAVSENMGTIRKLASDARALIKSAGEKNAYNVAQHTVAQVPSIEVIAYDVQDDPLDRGRTVTPVVLSVDSSDLRTIRVDAVTEILDLVYAECQE